MREIQNVSALRSKLPLLTFMIITNDRLLFVDQDETKRTGRSKKRYSALTNVLGTVCSRIGSSASEPHRTNRFSVLTARNPNPSGLLRKLASSVDADSVDWFPARLLISCDVSSSQFGRDCQATQGWNQLRARAITYLYKTSRNLERKGPKGLEGPHEVRFHRFNDSAEECM